MKDATGRDYAKMSELKVGDVVELDNGFTCMSGRKTVQHNDAGLYVTCAEGKHYLNGQADDGEHYIGIYKL